MRKNYEIQPDFLIKLKTSLDGGEPHPDLNVINEISKLAEQKEMEKGLKGIKREQERTFISPALSQEFGAVKPKLDISPILNKLTQMDLEIETKLLDLEELILDEVEPEVLENLEYIKLVQSIKSKYNF